MPEDPHTDLQNEAARIRASGVLGDARVLQLFDYLVENSLAGRAPKEIAIAMGVFGKDARFDVSQDALVRVYIHKLRRILADFYKDAGGRGTTLHIPRGEYRLVASTAPPAAEPLPEPAVPPPPRLAIRRPSARHAASWGAALLGAALLGVCLGLWLRGPKSDLDQVRGSAPWSWVRESARPIVIAVGDYYLVGETDASMEVRRLIREYSVNSKSDLDRYLKGHPEEADRYIDVGLRYMPTAVAFALRDVMPLLSGSNRQIGVTMMSDLTPGMLKSADIVYIGYLSGLGIMKDLVFAASRFAVGDSYDELLDKTTKRRFVSQTASQNLGEPKNSGVASPYRDYGFFSTFRGPDGNVVMVIAGTRDEGVRETAEMFTNRARLRELEGHADLRAPFEALLEVAALDGVNLNGRLLFSSKRTPPPAN